MTQGFVPGFARIFPFSSVGFWRVQKGLL